MCNFDENQRDFELELPIQQFSDDERLAFDERTRQYQQSVHIHSKMLILQDQQTELNNPDDPIADIDIQLIQHMNMDEVCVCVCFV